MRMVTTMIHNLPCRGVALTILIIAAASGTIASAQGAPLGDQLKAQFYLTELPAVMFHPSTAVADYQRISANLEFDTVGRTVTLEWNYCADGRAGNGVSGGDGRV